MYRYLEILGLAPGATKEQIKKAYRRMAKKYHPDRNPGPDAQQRFLEITEAYEYLMGERKQRQAFKGHHFSEDEKHKIYEILKEAAERRARKKYRERVRRFRKEQERAQSKEFTKGIYILIGVVALGLIIWQANILYRNMMISANPVITEVEVTGIGNKRMLYSFETEEGLYSDRCYVSRVGISMLAGNGMPLKIGDRFEVSYRRGNPKYHRINYERVSTATMNRYFRLTADRFRYLMYKQWEDLSESEQQIRAECLTLLVFSDERFHGLSKVIFSETNPLDNFSSNSIHWWWMRRSDDFKGKLKLCREPNPVGLPQ